MQLQSMSDGKKLCFVILGCFGGLFIQLVIGSLYQWGIINIYITSYYRLLDPAVTLEGNAIAFPVMMLCIGFTMRIGLFLSQKTHPLIILSINAVLSAACIFIASYVDQMGAFIALYGIIFGLISGLNFMIPIVQCKKMYINGVILIGTGSGSVVFGLFSYGFLNPDKLRPLTGYYLGAPQLQEIALKVPECLRWLSLLYLVIGVLGVLMLAPVCLENRRRKIANEEAENKIQKLKDHEASISEIIQNNIAQEQFAERAEKQQQEQQPQRQEKTVQASQGINREKLPPLKPLRLPPVHKYENEEPKSQKENSNKKQKEEEKKQNKQEVAKPSTEDHQHLGYATDLKQAFCSFVCWYQALLLILGSCGVFLVNGNYKTYVKEEIDDDQFLTIIGIVGSVGNGVSRFFWNMLFSRTGYKTVMLLNLSIQIIVYSTIRFTVFTPPAYLFLVFLVNCCLGGLLVMAPTFAQEVFGQATGSNIYGFYWTCFAIANLIQFAFVAGISATAGFQTIIYIVLGMTVISIFMIIFGKFQGPWMNSLDSLKYCSHCC